LAYATSGTVLILGSGFWYLQCGRDFPASSKTTRRPPPSWSPPPRADMLKALKAAGNAKTDGPDSDIEFDLLVVGGGATGAGCAVDAASRGLRVALVERVDFGAGK